MSEWVACVMGGRAWGCLCVCVHVWEGGVGEAGAGDLSNSASMQSKSSGACTKSNRGLTPPGEAAAPFGAAVTLVGRAAVGLPWPCCSRPAAVLRDGSAARPAAGGGLAGGWRAGCGTSQEPSSARNIATSRLVGYRVNTWRQETNRVRA